MFGERSNEACKSVKTVRILSDRLSTVAKSRQQRDPWQFYGAGARHPTPAPPEISLRGDPPKRPIANATRIGAVRLRSESLKRILDATIANSGADSHHDGPQRSFAGFRVSPHIVINGRGHSRRHRTTHFLFGAATAATANNRHRPGHRNRQQRRLRLKQSQQSESHRFASPQVLKRREEGIVSPTGAAHYRSRPEGHFFTARNRGRPRTTLLSGR